MELPLGRQLGKHPGDAYKLDSVADLLVRFVCSVCIHYFSTSPTPLGSVTMSLLSNSVAALAASTESEFSPISLLSI